MLLDLHMHSAYSQDAKPNAAVTQVCSAAIEKGLSIIALTDHYDYYYGNKPPIAFDTLSQQQEISQCNSLYQGALEILKGVEVGQIHAGTGAEQYLQQHQFDMIIGSVHVYRPNDTDIYFQKFEEMNQISFLKEYLEEVLHMVRYGGFHVLAHLDYPLRVMKLPNNHPTLDGFEVEIECVLREIINREIALEINAASLFGWQEKVGPSLKILEMYHNLGGRMISIGSDSHCAADVGRGIAQCIAHAKQAGFHTVTVFRKGKAQEVAI